jgi:putative transposase
VYNHFLDAKQKHYEEHKKTLSYGECSKQLIDLKREHTFLGEVSSVPIQQALRHLENAFQRFYNKQARFPNFKKRYYEQSATFMKNAFTFKEGELFIAKFDQPLKIRWSRKFEGEPTSITLSKDRQERYYISLLVEEFIRPLSAIIKTVGIDLGLTNSITTSDGKKEQPALFLKTQLKRLKRRQQALSRKKKGSSNRSKARKAIGRLSSKIRDRRVDYLHKKSKALVSENQVICAEKLNVKGMMKNKHLAQRIADTSWGTLLQFLTYKSAWYGRQFVQIDPFFPSTKQCSHCKHINGDLTLADRMWSCPICNTEHDRDVTAAINIEEEGLRQIQWCTVGHTGCEACGADVRPTWQTMRQSAVKQELGL